jgi:membrane-associated protease RseP (regulator of RpoE activity)
LSQPSPEIDSLVRDKFQVKDSFNLPGEEVEFKVVYDASSKVSFQSLWSKLNEIGYTPWLVGSKDNATLIVRKKQTAPASRSRIPVLLLFLTLASVVAFGLLQALVYQQLAPGFSAIVVVVSYSVCVVAILAAHEFGRRRAAERAGVSSPTPFFLPGVPGFTSLLPSMGVVASQREPAVNRDSLFDLTIAGPLVAFLVVLAIYGAGEFAWIQSSVTLQSAQAINSFIQIGKINPSLIQYAMDTIASPFLRAVPDGYVRMSPLLDAGTFGFFLTFLSLLPITQFDGGRLFSTAFGGRGLTITTIVSALALVVIDYPNYLFLGLFVFLIAGRATNIQVLDDLSPASRSRKVLFLVALAVALLSLPLPQNIASISLG